MAKLKRLTFRRWAPDIGDNRHMKEGPALFFDLATGLTTEELEAIQERMKQPIAEYPPEIAEDETKGEERFVFVVGELRRRYLEAFGKYVRIIGGPHSIDDRPLESLEDYLIIVESQADKGKAAVTDLFSALVAFNSFTGPDELFSPRRSGSPASTEPQSVEKTEPKTAGP